MKCVKYMDGKMDRIADAEARSLVLQGKASFMTRKEWKEKVRPFLTKVAPEVALDLKEQKKNENRVGKAIAQARKSKNMTQDEVALKLGVQKSEISAIERGKSVADDEMLDKLTNAIGVDIRSKLK